MEELIELIIIPSIIGGTIGTIGTLIDIKKKDKERMIKNENANTK